MDEQIIFDRLRVFTFICNTHVTILLFELKCDSHVLNCLYFIFKLEDGHKKQMRKLFY